MLLGIPGLSWLTFALTILSLIVLTYDVDPHTPAGVARLVVSGILGVVAVLTLITGARIGRRISAIEAGRYPRMRPGASHRIAERIQLENPQTATIAGEGGDDIREVAAVLLEALRSANWHVRETSFGATLWNGGTGIMVYHTEAAAPAATALIEALKAEDLSVTHAGNCTTGLPVHIAFRRP